MRGMTTPPPPERTRTPPAPLHGVAFDSFEPFSPRRSTRHKRDHNLVAPVPKLSLSRKTALDRITSFSPPSSPDPLAASSRETPARPAPVRRSLFTRERPTASAPFGPDLNLGHATPQVMLPTPNKTPIKRDNPALKSTARILNFKAARVDDAMPPIQRKRNKSRLTLNEDVSRPQNDFMVYTDIQDRMPVVEATEDNPFVGPRKPRAYYQTRSRTSYVNSADPSMEEAVKNHEGIIYVFRGKSFFRRFSDGKNIELNDDDAYLMRMAGAAASRPITRSGLKPRLLFPSAHDPAHNEDEAPTNINHEPHTDVDEDEALTDIEEGGMTVHEEEPLTDSEEGGMAVHEEEALTDIEEEGAKAVNDEEALTDIEEDNMPCPAAVSFCSSIHKTMTPAKTPAKALNYHPATPPSSHRQTRSASKKMALFADPTPEINALASPSATPMPKSKGKNFKIFNDWQRNKTDDSPRSAPNINKRPRALSGEIPKKRNRTDVAHATDRT